MPTEMGIENGTFFIKDYETSDYEIVSFFSDMDPESLREKFERSLKIGVVSLKTIGTTERIDYIEKVFSRLDRRFVDILEKTAKEIEEQIANVFGEKGTFPEIIEEHFGENGKIVKQIFDPTVQGTPLCRLKTSILDEISRLRTQLGIEEAKEEIVAVTPKKGYEFEDMCEEMLNEIVSTQMGDQLARTTDTTGRITGSKQGDFVITLGERPDCRIVLETKDRESVSLPEIRETMEEAIKNRDAKYGIFVIRYVEALPSSVGWFNEYPGNCLVCALGTRERENLLCKEILFIAYNWAKIKSLLEFVKAEGLDISLVQTKLKEVESKLELFRQIKLECTNVESAVNKIRAICDEIRQGINLELAAIYEEIARATG